MKRGYLSRHSNSHLHFNTTVNLLKFKRSQITVFVIIALILVAGIVGYFLVKNDFFNKTIPKDLSGVYEYYDSCISSIVLDGAKMLGSRAGYIENPVFSPGSEYSPFSSELDFMGQGVPYWYYISGNGVEKEQIPTKKMMQEQLNIYFNEQVANCGFESFESQGYLVAAGEAKATTEIQDNKIVVNVNQKLSVSYGDSKYTITNRKLEVNSRLGEFYNFARKIYDYEKKNMFLENYSVDVLYTYAPVSGTALNCSPLIWQPQKVFNDLKLALEANIQSLKVSGDSYDIKKPYGSYYIVGKGGSLNAKNSQVSFLYSKDWVGRFEVWPTKGNLMIANPIGNQPGLSAMGFCYIPYKFVYDMYFPVLIQIYSNDGEEVFQFPVSIVINKNLPRKASPSTFIEPEQSVCDNANTNISIYTYDITLAPVEADLKFKCLTSSCSLGRTKLDNTNGSASLNALVAQCVNGVLIANAAGYKEKKYIISTNQEYSADIVLDKEYKLPLEIYVDGVLTKSLAILSVYENNENSSNAIGVFTYPSNNKIDISEGDYIFNLEVYGSNMVTIPETTTTQCAKVPVQGIFGFFGIEEEKCNDIKIPSQQLTNVLSAGGKINQYITPSELSNAKVFRVYASSIKLPTNADEVQLSYDLINIKSLDIEIV